MSQINSKQLQARVDRCRQVSTHALKPRWWVDRGSCTAGVLAVLPWPWVGMWLTSHPVLPVPSETSRFAPAVGHLQTAHSGEKPGDPKGPSSAPGLPPTAGVVTEWIFLQGLDSGQRHRVGSVRTGLLLAGPPDSGELCWVPAEQHCASPARLSGCFLFCLIL